MWKNTDKISLEVTQLPRERWHPAERPPEMAVIATA